MDAFQSKINLFTTNYHLQTRPETRFIDLASEVGELGKEILKSTNYSTKDFTPTDNLASELGDTLFSLICLANNLNVNLSDALDDVLAKYSARFSTSGQIGSKEH